jgi:hypothetical protein
MADNTVDNIMRGQDCVDRSLNYNGISNIQVEG